MSYLRFLAALSASLLLLGCASVPADLGRGDIERQLSINGLPASDAPLSDAQLQQWLAEPLSRDRAIQIALLRNPELRARYAQLGLAAADVYEAGRLANPLLSYTQLSAGSAASSQLTLGVAVNFTDLLMLRSRSRLADSQFAVSKAQLAAATLALAADVEAAYWRVAASAQAALLRKNLADTAALSAKLADRYFDAGNLRAREQALEQATAVQAQLQLVASELDAQQARNAFNRLLGLRISDGHWQLAETLQLPPASDASLDELLTFADRSRLDLNAAQQQTDALAARYGLSRRTRLLGDISVGAEREREFDGSVHTGPSASVSLPLFDWGRGRTLRAQAQLDTAEAQLTALQLDVGGEVQAAYDELQAARTRIDLYRQQLLPARAAVVEQLQREVNYMLSGAFELMAARQQNSDAIAAYVDTLRDYWIARAQLSRAVGRRLPDTSRAVPAADSEGPTDAVPSSQEHHHQGDRP